MKKNLYRLIIICLLVLPVHGYGMEQSEADETRAKAEQGRVDAQFELGLMYYLGHGVEQSYAEAVKWYNKAAEHGHAEAMDNLGWCYYYGNGVAQDYVQAYVWFALAVKRGSKFAKESIKVVEKNLTPEQLATAKKQLATRSPPQKKPRARQYRYPYPATGIHLF